MRCTQPQSASTNPYKKIRIPKRARQRADFGSDLPCTQLESASKNPYEKIRIDNVGVIMVMGKKITRYLKAWTSVRLADSRGCRTKRNEHRHRHLDEIVLGCPWSPNMKIYSSTCHQQLGNSIATVCVYVRMCVHTCVSTQYVVHSPPRGTPI